MRVVNTVAGQRVDGVTALRRLLAATPGSGDRFADDEQAEAHPRGSERQQDDEQEHVRVGQPAAGAVVARAQPVVHGRPGAAPVPRGHASAAVRGRADDARSPGQHGIPSARPGQQRRDGPDQPTAHVGREPIGHAGDGRALDRQPVVPEQQWPPSAAAAVHQSRHVHRVQPTADGERYGQRARPPVVVERRDRNDRRSAALAGRLRRVNRLARVPGEVALEVVAVAPPVTGIAAAAAAAVVIHRLLLFHRTQPTPSVRVQDEPTTRVPRPRL